MKAPERAAARAVGCRYFLFSSRTLKQKYVDAGGEPTDYRDAGIGGTLIEKIMGEARARGAKNMYISSANSQHTVEFYMRKGAVQAKGLLKTRARIIEACGPAGADDLGWLAMGRGDLSFRGGCARCEKAVTTRPGPQVRLDGLWRQCHDTGPALTHPRRDAA